MDQKKRDKMAVVLTVVLLPFLVYLVVKNVRTGRVNNPAQQVAAHPVSLSEKITIANMRQIVDSARIEPLSTMDTKVLEEQRKIAALLPKRSPFAVKKIVKPVTTVPADIPEKVLQLYLTGVVSQKESSKRAAIINGKFMEEGQKIEGWTVVRINVENVVLENGQDKITLQIGRK